MRVFLRLTKVPMALETATHINDLVIANPTGLDDVSQGDEHLRLLKDVLKRDLPMTAAASASGLTVLQGTPAASRTALGSGAIGDALFLSTTNTAAENAMGVTRGIATNGWRKTGDGLMVQWGTSTGTTNASSAITVTFPTAFPTGAFTVIASNGDTAATLGSVSTVSLTASNFVATFALGAAGVGAGVAVRVNWIAYGN